MEYVQYRDADLFQFASEFAQTLPKHKIHPGIDKSNLTLELPENLASLFRYASMEAVFVLPYCLEKKDFWFITGKDYYELKRFLDQITHFVIPTYANFSDGYAQLNPYTEQDHTIQALGREFFVGYYKWISPKSTWNTIIERLNLHLAVQTRAQQYDILPQKQPTYHQVKDQFELALAAQDWLVADRAIQEISRLNLTTADNISFLRVQLLAQQQKWKAIFEYPRYKMLTEIPVPRAIRAALITAFHYQILFPFEQSRDITRAFTAFKANRDKLGKLLIGRFDLHDREILRVFSYQAVFENNPLEIERLKFLASDDETQQIMSELGTFITQPAEISGLTPFQSARLAMLDANFEEALRLRDRIEDVLDRVYLELEVGYFTKDPLYMTHAIEAFEEFYIEDQIALGERYPKTEQYIAEIEAQIRPKDVPPPDWITWFRDVLADPENQSLSIQLEHLKTNTDERNWNDQSIHQLTEVLMEVTISDTNRTQLTPLIRSALQHLINQFALEQGFPRSNPVFVELYEVFYTILADIEDRSSSGIRILLRYIEALLQHSPERWREFFEQIEHILNPVPALHECALEALELISSYTAQGASFVQWYRNWASQLVDHPLWERTDVEVWLSFGEWLQPGSDLLQRLQDRLSQETEEQEIDPIARLESGYTIAIFSLDESSARRTKNILLKRNSELDVELCHEKVNSPRVESLAKSADMAVLVSSCISHALFYSVQPFIEDPVYPDSRGSSSILRAIEDRLKRSSNRGIS